MDLSYIFELILANSKIRITVRLGKWFKTFFNLLKYMYNTLKHTHTHNNNTQQSVTPPPRNFNDSKV